jgi:hypothetical protein
MFSIIWLRCRLQQVVITAQVCRGCCSGMKSQVESETHVDKALAAPSGPFKRQQCSPHDQLPCSICSNRDQDCFLQFEILMEPVCIGMLVHKLRCGCVCKLHINERACEDSPVQSIELLMFPIQYHAWSPTTAVTSQTNTLTSQSRNGCFLCSMFQIKREFCLHFPSTMKLLTANGTSAQCICCKICYPKHLQSSKGFDICFQRLSGSQTSCH